MALIPEFKDITKLIKGGDMLEKEISRLPRKNQKNMYILMKQLMLDEIIFVLEVEKQRARMDVRVNKN